MSPLRGGSNMLGRNEVLAGRPRRLPAVRTQQRDNGGLLVTVRLERPRWQRWLGAAETFERSFGLDPLGRAVYERCDGKRSVDELTRSFAREHKLSHAQAEIAVTTFLRTMIRKGLVAIEISQRGGPAAGGGGGGGGGGQGQGQRPKKRRKRKS